MHTRRLSTLLLGAWLSASFFMTWVATSNFDSVERVLNSTSAKAQRELKDIGPARARMLLRYHSSEQNRHYFYYWEWVQIGLGIVLVVVLLFATNGNRLVMSLSTSMVVLIAVMHFTITPQITEVGRAVDFSTSDEMNAEKEVFWNYHKAYAALEVVKIALGLLLAVRLVYASRQIKRRSSSVRKSDSDVQVDA